MEFWYRRVGKGPFLLNSHFCVFSVLQQFYSVNNYVQYVQEALDLAHQHPIPKMLVQVVPQFDISRLRYMSKDMSCDFIQKYLTNLTISGFIMQKDDM